MMLENKIAVIYGGGGAMGGAVARAFASAGARVYLAGRTADRLEAVANDIGGAAWKTVPSWFVFPELDSIVPLALHRFMAERAQAREAVEIAQASHAVAVSRPDAVADVILTAAKFIA
jgi:NAD(P)-dependent dehydrogenase (short-subunit alcohol dehydrogenase family)